MTETHARTMPVYGDGSWERGRKQRGPRPTRRMMDRSFGNRLGPLPKSNEYREDVLAVAERFQREGPPADAYDELEEGENSTIETASARREKRRVIRQQALSYRLAGLTYEQIGSKLDISGTRAYQVVNETLNRSENLAVTEMRELENQRLDRAQAAIWPEVLRGDHSAIDRFLSISRARVRLNGLDAPQKLDISFTVQNEMEKAFSELEQVILEGEIVDEVDAPLVAPEDQMGENRGDPEAEPPREITEAEAENSASSPMDETADDMTGIEQIVDGDTYGTGH